MNATEINWQDAVAVLARERTQAVAAARIVKKYPAARGERPALAHLRRGQGRI